MVYVVMAGNKPKAVFTEEAQADSFVQQKIDQAKDQWPGLTASQRHMITVHWTYSAFPLNPPTLED